MWLRDATIVLPDRVLEAGAVRIDAGRIADITEGKVAEGYSLAGLTLLPGLVDIHGDMLELEIEPRPNTAFPLELALREVDKRLVGNGITTAFAAIATSWQDLGNVRSEAQALEIMRTVHALRQEMLADHRVHVRFAITNPSFGPELKELMQQGAVGLVSFMDHTPGQGQYRDLETYVGFSQQWRKSREGEEISEAEVWRHVEAMQARPKAWDVVEELSSLARQLQIPIASHDDDSATKVAFVSQLGVVLSEFPINLEAAQAAREHGMHVAMGAPNAFRGVSSTAGNLSATAAIQAGVVDTLASDYHPPSMLHAAYALVAREVAPMPDAIKLVSAHPAHAVGMGDIGCIETGRWADLTIVDDDGFRKGKLPRVRGTLRRGRPVYWDSALPPLPTSNGALPAREVLCS